MTLVAVTALFVGWIDARHCLASDERAIRSHVWATLPIVGWGLLVWVVPPSPLADSWTGTMVFAGLVVLLGAAFVWFGVARRLGGFILGGTAPAVMYSAGMLLSFDWSGVPVGVPAGGRGSDPGRRAQTGPAIEEAHRRQEFPVDLPLKVGTVDGSIEADGRSPTPMVAWHSSECLWAATRRGRRLNPTCWSRKRPSGGRQAVIRHRTRPSVHRRRWGPRLQPRAPPSSINTSASVRHDRPAGSGDLLRRRTRHRVCTLTCSATETSPSPSTFDLVPSAHRTLWQPGRRP